jgi:SAM-dependent methyltransferase
VTSDFYSAFETQYRGTRELIKDRLKVYLQFVVPLAQTSPHLPVHDLGCGRGEWLELLQEQRVPAHGIDLDPLVIKTCQQLQFSVSQADALAHLKVQADNSLLVVSAFHVAEHLPFADLQALYAQALRVLAPGGLFILETPNPENLAVGTANFYLDPTHLRPLPFQILTFLAQQSGFARVKHLRLQEEPRLHQDLAVSLFDVLANVSPDHAIVAQKQLSQALPLTQSQALEQVFATEFGLSLQTLAQRFDHQIPQFQSLTTLLEQQDQKQEEQHQSLSLRLEQQTQAAQTQANAQQNAVEKLQSDVAHISAQAQDMASSLNQILNSKSWRYTRPLRGFVNFIKSLFISK